MAAKKKVTKKKAAISPKKTKKKTLKSGVKKSPPKSTKASLLKREPTKLSASKIAAAKKLAKTKGGAKPKAKSAEKSKKKLPLPAKSKITALTSAAARPQRVASTLVANESKVVKQAISVPSSVKSPAARGAPVLSTAPANAIHEAKSDNKPQGTSGAAHTAQVLRSVPPAARSQNSSPTSTEKSLPRESGDGLIAKPVRTVAPRNGFKLNESVVYPAHGVGQIVSIEEQEVVGFKLELYVINFAKDKMTLRVPTSKVTGVGMRKLSEPEVAKRALDILTGRARIKRTMWSRRAQEYEAKINSGDINSIAEVVRDLYRSDAQPEQSYSERQLYEAALDRIVREIAAVEKISELDAVKIIEGQLHKGQKRAPKAAAGTNADSVESEIEEAA